MLDEWRDHKGNILDSKSDFRVLDCQACQFKHIIPLPTDDSLEELYQDGYYATEVPLYIERNLEDLEWWNTVFDDRLDTLEESVDLPQRSVLDVGSGPGFFLKRAESRGWKVTGIEPSKKAAEYARSQGLAVTNDFLNDKTAPALGRFDAVYMNEVLEHIPEPKAFLQLAHDLLNENGTVCICVPNEYSPFQKALKSHLGYKAWWVAPPDHLNYFSHDSLAKLVSASGFEILKVESTFPIDLFLMMGDNYVGNDKLGRECHAKRKTMEINFKKSGLNALKRDLYSKFAELGIGREIVLYARKQRIA